MEKRIRSLIIVLCQHLFISHLIAQTPTPHNIRESDVMWSTSVWREIDLRQKINQVLYYPIDASDGYMSLFDALITEINEGYLTPYSPGPLGDNDQLNVPLSLKETQSILSRVDSSYTVDPDTEESILVVQDSRIQSEDIMKYRIKEVWMFDKQQSRMIPRIVAIAPIINVYGDDGELRGTRVLFWVRYDQAQFGLQFYPVFLRHNDNKDLTYHDVFAKRFFDSYIIKQSNVPNRYINEYAFGVDALLESDQIEERIRTFESDLWDH